MLSGERHGMADVYDEMRWLLWILALLIVDASSGCNSGSSTTVVAGEDIHVLRAILNSACALEWKQVVSDMPIAPFHKLVSVKGAPNVQFGLNLDVRLPTEARWPRGEICASVRVVDDAVIKDVMSRETSIPPRWTFFRERFDGAKKLTRVSLPVYSVDGRSAVVYVEGTCPYSCGAGFFYELRNVGGEWKILRSRNVSRM